MKKYDHHVPIKKTIKTEIAVSEATSDYSLLYEHIEITTPAEVRPYLSALWLMSPTFDHSTISIVFPLVLISWNKLPPCMF